MSKLWTKIEENVLLWLLWWCYGVGDQLNNDCCKLRGWWCKVTPKWMMSSMYSALPLKWKPIANKWCVWGTSKFHKFQLELEVDFVSSLFSNQWWLELKFHFITIKTLSKSNLMTYFHVFAFYDLPESCRGKSCRKCWWCSSHRGRTGWWASPWPGGWRNARLGPCRRGRGRTSLCQCLFFHSGRRWRLQHWGCCKLGPAWNRCRWSSSSWTRL